MSLIRGPATITHRLDDEKPRLINGIQPANIGEARVATSLDRLRHRYIYQFQILDIKGVRGAYRIDFLVLTTAPLSTPLEVFGEYWHEGRMGDQDQFRIAQIEQHFRGKALPVVVVFGSEIQNQEDTDDVIRRKVGAP